MSLTAGAWAIAAQHGMGVDPLVAVGPVDLGRAGAARRPNGDGLETRILGHGDVLRRIPSRCGEARAWSECNSFRARPRLSSPATAPGRDTAFLPIMWPTRNAARQIRASCHALEPGTARAATSAASAPAL